VINDSDNLQTAVRLFLVFLIAIRRLLHPVLEV